MAFVEIFVGTFVDAFVGTFVFVGEFFCWQIRLFTTLSIIVLVC